MKILVRHLSRSEFGPLYYSFETIEQQIKTTKSILLEGNRLSEHKELLEYFDEPIKPDLPQETHNIERMLEYIRSLEKYEQDIRDQKTKKELENVIKESEEFLNDTQKFLDRFNHITDIKKRSRIIKTNLLYLIRDYKDYCPEKLELDELID